MGVGEAAAYRVGGKDLDLLSVSSPKRVGDPVQSKREVRELCRRDGYKSPIQRYWYEGMDVEFYEELVRFAHYVIKLYYPGCGGHEVEDLRDALVAKVYFVMDERPWDANFGSDFRTYLFYVMRNEVSNYLSRAKRDVMCDSLDVDGGVVEFVGVESGGVESDAVDLSGIGFNGRFGEIFGGLQCDIIRDFRLFVQEPFDMDYWNTLSREVQGYFQILLWGLFRRDVENRRFFGK
jgi:hypothetical protein